MGGWVEILNTLIWWTHEVDRCSCPVGREVRRWAERVLLRLLDLETAAQVGER